jgi:hypothetical protein
MKAKYGNAIILWHPVTPAGKGFAGPQYFFCT